MRKTEKFTVKISISEIYDTNSSLSSSGGLQIKC